MNGRGWLARALALAGLVGWVLVGCGGGVGSGGTGVASGVTDGTVNGFGSVFVDGDRFDDSAVAAYAETAPGVQTQADARLGARVEVESELGKATRLRVEAALVAPVESVSADGFQVLGQKVRINATASNGPVTQFGGGYAGFATVQPGDAVEVHGFTLRTAAGFELQATRVQRLAAVPAFVRVSGLASNVDAAGFDLGSLRVISAGAAMLPAGAPLVSGQSVTVLAPRVSLMPASGPAQSLHAAQVRIRVLGQAGDQVATSGGVGSLDLGAGRFDLGGTMVDYRQASVRPEVGALVAGRYVQVRGTLAADGTLMADTVRVLDGRSSAEAELKGNILGLDATGLRFQVRGVDVDASRADIEECPGGRLTEGAFVEIEGRLGPTGVIAKSVQCKDAPTDATIERKGVAGSVDGANRRFVLTRSDGSTLAVSWTELTYFKNVTAVTLSGQQVEVTGQLVDGVLVAKKIQVESEDD